MLNTDEIIRSYFTQNNILIKHQIESYNYYVDSIIPNIISQFFPITLTYNDDNIIIKKVVLNIKNIKIKKPLSVENNGCSKMMTPNIARLKNDTYLSSVIVDFISHITIKENDKLIELEEKVIENIILGKIPIMVKSKYCILDSLSKNNECQYDPGGYFIINGNEKVIICQEKIVHNLIQIYKNNKLSNKYAYLCEIRFLDEKNFGIPKTVSLKITSKPNIYGNKFYILLPHMKNEIPIFVLFRALGCGPDKDIIYYILDNNGSKIDETMKKVLRGSIEEAYSIRTENEAIKYMIKHINNNSYYSQSDEKKYNYIKNCILKEYLNHLGDNNLKKLYFTGYMINKLIKCYLGIIPLDDRDSYINKRLETTGNLLGTLTYQTFHKITKDIKNFINKEICSGLWNFNNKYNEIINEINIHKIIKSSYLENILKGAMATGNWGIKMNSNKQGVSQVLNRLSYLSTLSHLRRIQTPSDNTGKLIPPRKLHGTSWGYLCPSETPEGQAGGVVKNLAMNCEVTIQMSSEPIRCKLIPTGMEQLTGTRISIPTA